MLRPRIGACGLSLCVLVAIIATTPSAQSMSELRAAANVDGRLSLAGLSSGGAYDRISDAAGACWGDWAGPAGRDLRRIELATNSDGRLELFGLGGDGAVYHRWQTSPGGSWNEWQPLYGTRLTEINALADGLGRLVVLALSADGTVYRIAQASPGASFGNWSAVGGRQIVRITAARNTDGRLQVFGVDAKGAISHSRQTSVGGEWTAWEPLYGTNLNQILAAPGAGGRLTLLALSGDGSVYYTSQTTANGLTWNNWNALGGHDVRQIAVGRNADGRLELFAAGADGIAYHKWQLDSAGTWGEWSSLHGIQLQTLAAVTAKNGRLVLFARSADGAIYQTAQTTPGGSWQSWSPSAPCARPSYEQLAAYWAPVISHDVDAANVRADYLTSFNYDDNWSAWDNWRNLDAFDLPSVVYYWVLESPSRYFIGYGLFHPRDWSSHGGDEHDNDLEGVLLAIAKHPSTPYGQFEALNAIAHETNFSFADDDTPASSAWFAAVARSQNMTGEDEDVDFVIDDIGVHPVVYVQAEGHGTYGHPLTGKNAWHILDDWAPFFIDNKITDWRGADWTGTPFPPVSGAVARQYDRRGWGDGVIYRYEGTGDVLGRRQVTSSSSLAKDWQVAGYALVSMQSLWDRREDFRLSGEMHVFSAPGSFGPNGGAQAPWGWGDGAFFTDPARYLADRFKGWAVPQPNSCEYIGNSLGAPTTGCLVKPG